jgi:glutaredoxin-related protein
MGYKLYPHQEEALKRIRSGSIVNGGVGSGKTLTSLAFYMRYFSHKKLYVITTAKKRDTGDWEEDAEKVGAKIEVVDSWNNIKNYMWLDDCFVIFDEQRVVGYSAWGKAFIKICKSNKWILLTATPGDTWMEYMTVFIANGFYRNKTDFVDQHVEFDQWVKYPKIKNYHNVGKLARHRHSILVPMHFERTTTRHRKYIPSQYSQDSYDKVMKNRWNIFEEKPIENASEMTSCLRKIVASDEDRKFNAKFLMDIHDRLIIFYNYNYERDILIELANELGKPYWEWNGHAHQEVPDRDEWLYIVQYTAGAEGWNCITTNTILFYSMNYSYKITEQAEGRIDRLNTKYKDLEYYFLTSNSDIDKSVYKAILTKQKFNESAWLKGRGIQFQS